MCSIFRDDIVISHRSGPLLFEIDRQKLISNTNSRSGWHRNENPDLGQVYFQYSAADEANRWGITFKHETSSLILWEIVENLAKDSHPDYQYANEES